MPNLDLSDLELITIKEVLESYLSDLRMEIADTDSADYREGLKEKKQLIQALVERMPAKAS